MDNGDLKMRVRAILQEGRHQEKSLDAGVLAAWSRLDLIFHSVAFALDEDGLGMVQESVEDRGMLPPNKNGPTQRQKLDPPIFL